MSTELKPEELELLALLYSETLLTAAFAKSRCKTKFLARIVLRAALHGMEEGSKEENEEQGEAGAKRVGDAIREFLIAEVKQIHD